MPNNRDLHDPVDRFSEHFRQRLKAYPVLPDEDCWDEIEARLQKKRGLFPLWLGLSVAASILAAVLVFDYVSTEKEQHMRGITTFHTEMLPKDTVAIDTYINPVAATDKHIRKPKPVPADETCIEQETPVRTDEKRQDVKKEQKKKQGQEQDEKQETGPEKPYRTFENITAYTIPGKNKRSQHKGWQVSAGLSSISGVPSVDFLSDHGYLPNTPNDSSSGGYLNDSGDVMHENPGPLSTKRIIHVKPAIPFTVGVMVRRKWNKILGVEIGLAYTRLSSDLIIENNTYTYDAVLNLHYVGIPVNVTANLRQKDRVSLYASGGGMAEKGLRAVYKQKMPVLNHFIRQDDIYRISGLQWSLNGGIGLSYNFYGDMDLYVEPGIAYYFDCNQPVSKRTEDPLNFNLKVGIRYDF